MFRVPHRESPKPLAKTEGMSVTVSEYETLVYLHDEYVIHRLDELTAKIWNLADGSRNMADLARAAGCSRASVDRCLHTLAEIGLIDASTVGKSLWTRRRILGVAGATAVGTYMPAAATS